MASLLDIAPSCETATVRGIKIDVPGVSSEGLAILMRQHESLRDLLMGKGMALDLDDILKTGPATIAAILAAGCGMPGNEAAEKQAVGLALHDQAVLLDKVMKVTLPDGAKNLQALLVSALNQAGLSQTPSPQPSNTSSQVDTVAHGRIRRAHPLNGSKSPTNGAAASMPTS